MKVICAENMGFCSGVKRAVDMALKQKDAFVLGQLIHNPQVVEMLDKKGIKEISSVDDIEKGSLIITAHGTTKSNVEKAKIKGLKIIDTTCPLVKKVQDLAKEFSSKGYDIILFGDKGHSEVKGIVSNAENIIVISSKEDAKNVFVKKACLLSQTTQSIEKFNEISKVLKSNVNELKIINTICNATKKRQDSAMNIAKKVDIMIVIGGYNSANTKRLNEICSKITETKHIETTREIKKEWFQGKKSVGITAGASTPDFVIKEIKKKIESL
ncbi:MAG: 4-hydroxy-3-methylbut-2-enyl diphosphate reductase [Candidatus Nanoarchaeia archaeon]|nr:4-hydroxy-3-methylbut-2-enyl diphosphate reductase [Candidatus Nanoarchaeia archaeon]